MIEVCCGCVEDCIKAQIAGADRIELNSALALGGLTPSLASVKLAKEAVEIPVIAMVRPRGSGFCYSEVEKKVIFEDAKILLEAGADGLAFGFLNADSTLDIENTKKMTELIHAYKKEAVFHRAFDCAEDPILTMGQLIDCHVDRVLTSGQKDCAEHGVKLLKELSDRFSDRIEILAGAGINHVNASAIMTDANITQVHSSCKMWLEDITSIKKAGSDINPEKYDVSDIEKIQKLIESIKK